MRMYPIKILFSYHKTEKTDRQYMFKTNLILKRFKDQWILLASLAENFYETLKTFDSSIVIYLIEKRDPKIFPWYLF